MTTNSDRFRLKVSLGREKNLTSMQTCVKPLYPDVADYIDSVLPAQDHE